MRYEIGKFVFSHVYGIHIKYSVTCYCSTAVWYVSNDQKQKCFYKTYININNNIHIVTNVLLLLILCTACRPPFSVCTSEDILVAGKPVKKSTQLQKNDNCYLLPQSTEEGHIYVCSYLSDDMDEVDRAIIMMTCHIPLDNQS